MDLEKHFLNELLNECSGEFDVVNKIDRLSRKLQEAKVTCEKDLKLEVNSSSELFNKTQTLETALTLKLKRSKELKSEINKQISIIKGLSSISQVSVENKLEKINNTRNLLSHIKDLHLTLTTIQTYIEENKYKEAALKIIQFEEQKLIGHKKFNGACLKRCKTTNHLYSSCIQLKNKLTKQILEVISDIIKWDTQEDTFCQHEKFVFEKKNEEDWLSYLTALHCLNSLDLFLARFSKNMTMKIFNPLITLHSTITFKDEISLSIETKLKEQNLKSENLEIAKSVKILENVNEIIAFIGSKLSIQYIVDENIKKDLTIEIRNKLMLDVFKLLAREVIDKSTPISIEKINDFNNLVSMAKKCQRTAEKYSLLNVDDVEINELLGDVEMAYVAHKCSDLLSKCRSLLKEPLHNTVQAGKGPFQSVANKNDPQTISSEIDFPTIELYPMFDFPLCLISKNVESLWQQVDNFVDDISKTNYKSNNVYSKVYTCVRDVVNLYMNIVPILHQHNDSTQLIPFFAAICHNNSMYMAHHSMLLHKTLKFKLQQYPNVASFVDYVEDLRGMGVHYLTISMRQLTKSISQNIKSVSGFDSISEAQNFEDVEKSWRKVSIELNHIFKAWYGVLPQGVLWKLIGSLFSTSLEEVTSSIIKLEDISETDAQKLTEILTIIEKDGRKLFTVDNAEEKTRATKDKLDDFSLEQKLRTNIELWTKLIELKFVLNARLMEIRDRWASGKGPLADVFVASEMDGLIRALFQNTEMRSAVLSTINR